MPDYTRKEFLDKLRESLPERYKILSDDRLLEATYQSGFKPEFKPEPEPDPGFIDGLVQPAKEQFYRIPETAASVYNSITEQMFPDDPELQKVRKDLYETASQYSAELIESDNRLKAFQQWAGENPFEWGKFVTNPTMFASTFSSVATSMGSIIGAGVLGELLGGPVGAVMAAGSTAYALESSEAYRSTYDRAKAKGYNDQEIDQMTADAAFMYGVGSAVLETAVPLSIIKSFGLSKRIAGKSFGKYASKYVDDVVAGNGGDSVGSGVRAWQQYANESITLAQKIKSYSPILGESLTEASTEGAQYLLQEGIVDNIVDQNEITLDWISQKLSTPEFSQGIAGGLLGGGVFSGGARLTKDVIYRNDGTKVADAMHKLGQKLPDEVRQKIYDNYVTDDNVSHIDKVKFAKRLTELEAGLTVQKATEEAAKVPEQDIKKETVQPEVKQPKVKTTPKTEPKKATQKPPEPSGSTQTKKTAPSIPKQEPASQKSNLVDQSNIAERLANPEKGRVTEVPGTDNKDRAFNWMALEGEKSVKRQLSKLPKEEKDAVLGLAASAIVESSENPELAKKSLYNKDGSINETELFNAMAIYSSQSRLVETQTISEGLGQPRQVKVRVNKGKQFFAEQLVNLERASTVSGIEAEDRNKFIAQQRDEILKDEAGDIVGDEVKADLIGETKRPSKTKVVKAKPTKQVKFKVEPRVEKFLNEKKLKPTSSKKATDFAKDLKFTDQEKKLYDKISKLLGRANVVEFEGELKIASGKFKGEKSAGLYLPGSDTVLVQKGKTGARTFLHEAVHLLTANAVNKPSNDKDRTFQKRISEIRKVAAEQSGSNAKVFQYLNQSDAEFIAGALTEPEFQRILASIPSTKKNDSLWSDFIEAVKKLLGVTKSDTLLDEAVNEIVSFIESPTQVKQEPIAKKESKPVPKPVKSTKAGTHTGSEINIEGHDITEDDDLSGFSRIEGIDPSYEINSEQPLYNIEDGRDGEPDSEDVQESEASPREFFFQSFGVYLTENNYGKLVEYINQYKDLKIDNANELKDFYVGLDTELKKLIRKTTGKDPIIENEEQHLDEVKEWFQKTLSRQPVIFEGVSGKGRNKLQLLLKVVDNKVVSKFLSPLKRIKLDTARMDDKGNVVGGKKHGKTDAISFIEYDQYKFGAKTKLFYMNTNDVYTQEVKRGRFGNKTFTIFRKANPFEFAFDGDQVKSMNSDFASAFLNGKDMFLKVFFAERSGDNSKLMIAAVPKNSPLAKYTRDDLEAMLLADAANGYLYSGEKLELQGDISGYTNHSGGAVGADSAWSRIGKEFGMTSNKHYYIEGNKTPEGNSQISKRESREADAKLAEANKVLNRKFPTSNEYVNNLLRRNWWQVKNSDAVFAISTIDNNIVQGGTGWAVHMAINEGKPVYVFDQASKSWFTWSDNKFIETGTPTLTKNFAGIGTRDINSSGMDAIRDVYKNSVGIEIIETIDHVQQFLDSGDALAESNPLIYAQLAILHDKWKQVKGFNYLTRFKDVASAYKRLKIDTTEGTLPVGVGDSSIMIIDPKEVEMTVVSIIDGIRIETPVKHLKADGSSAFDGALWSSKRRMNKLNQAMGKNAYVYKTFIRDLNWNKADPGYGIDYIGLKMAEFTPEPGMTIRKDGKVIAYYNGLVWFDANRNEFEMLATPDEVKDRSGVYAENYKIHRIPEHATRIKLIYDKSKTDGAHPVAAHELSLDPTYIEQNPYAQEYLQSVFEHYKGLVRDTVDKLYSFRPDPIFDDMTEAEKSEVLKGNLEKAKALREVVRTGLKPGQKLMEMDIVSEIFENGEGFFMPNFMRQLIHSLNNKYIIDGLFKARQMKKGNATKLLIKPNIGYNIPEDAVLVSAENKTMYNNVLKAYEVQSDVSLDGMNKSERIAQLNNWLRENPYWVLVHRQPIQSFTKVVPRRIYELTEGPQGQTIVMNLEDVFYLHDGDHDGDSVFVERFDNDLVEKMLNQSRQDGFNKRDRTVDLGMFVKGDLGNSLADINSVYKLIADRQNAAGAQGMAVNIKTTLARLAYKGFNLEFANGDKVQVYNPSDEAVVWYLPLDQKHLDSEVIYKGKKMTVLDRIKAQGDDVVQIGKDKVLKTTKENEFSILLQAAVDNDKFNLLSKLPLRDSFGSKISMHAFMLSRIFKIQSEESKVNVNQFSASQLKSLKAIYDIFNVSTLRSGNDSDRSRLDMSHVIQESEDYASMYYAPGSTSIASSEDVSNSVIVKFRQAMKSRKGYLNIKSIRMNNRITPSDLLVMAPGLRHRQLTSELDMYQSGLALDGPLLATPSMYRAAHTITMNELSSWIQEQYNNDRDSLNEIIKGINFADRVGTKFYDVFSKKEKGTKKVTQTNEDAYNIRFDYDEDIQNEVVEPHQEEFEAMSDIAKRWSSIRFMDGISYHDSKISSVNKLLPMQLMDRGVVKEYGKIFMNNIYNNTGDPTLRGSEARSRDITKIFANISTRAKEIESNKANHRIDSLNNRYCG